MHEAEMLFLTEIQPPLIVHSKRGRQQTRNDRASFGISLCIDGQITYHQNGKQYLSRPGYAVFFPKGASYALLGEREGHFPVVNFQCEGYDGQELLLLPLSDNDGCIRRFETLCELFFQKESRLKIFAVFYDLLACVFAQEEGTPHPMQAVMRYIEDKLDDPTLSNTRLAERIGVSEVYLRRLFREQLGTTPKQYILEKRLLRARKLLVDTTLNVTEVANACGFSSPYHFCRAFHQKMGQTPTEYARHNKIYQI